MDMGDSASQSASPPSKTSLEHNAPRPYDDINDENQSRKRPKLSPVPRQTSDIPLSKKGRACLACRKLKVKCDSAERGNAGCSRCQRLGLECVNARRLRVSLDGENEQPHPAIVRLDRAVEEILQKLKMPSLDVYGKVASTESNQTSKPTSDFMTTRENSKEPPDGETVIAPAPMGSLYEVTQLNSLRSKLRNANPTKRSSRRNMDGDLVSQKLISIDDAEQLLELYKKSLARYLYATTMTEDTTLQTVRESSTLLFTAVMLVSALHIPGKEAIHAICHKHFLDLIATSMFERFHTLDDIRALCIAAFWQPDLSWKLSGLCVRMATELNLHQAFYSAFYSQNINEEQRKQALEKARVWYLLYVLDHHFSIAYGRPPVTAELLPIKEYEVFINSPWCTLSDRRLISQVSLFYILSKAYEVFGLEPERLMGGDDTSLLMHLRFSEDIRAWRERWSGLLMPDKFIADYPSKGVQLHHHFSSLVLNSLALRGRPLDSTLATSLPPSLRPIALRAIESAHAILTFFLEEPSYRDSLVGVPLYLHSMIAFAVVFLIKMVHLWSNIGVSIDPESKTKPLIEGIIDILNKCKAGSGHMVYSMAAGFERMLRTRWGKPTVPKTTVDRPAAVHNNAHGGSKLKLTTPTFDNHHEKKSETGNSTQRQSYPHDANQYNNSTMHLNLPSPNPNLSIYHAHNQPSNYQHQSSTPYQTQPFASPDPSYFTEFLLATNSGGGMGGYGGYSLGIGLPEDNNTLWNIDSNAHAPTAGYDVDYVLDMDYQTQTQTQNPNQDKNQS